MKTQPLCNIFIPILLCFLFHYESSFASAYLAVDRNNQTGVENGSDAAPYSAIMTAIQAAASGSSIRVAAGTYNETIVIRDKTILLCGGYTGGTLYDSGQSGDFTNSSVNPSKIIGQSSQPVVLFIGSSSNSTIQKFTISSGSHGIVLDTDETWPSLNGITITNNIIENNISSDDTWGGGIMADGENIIISNNVIRNNRASRGGGVACIGDNFAVTANQILNNTVTSDHGGGMVAEGTGIISSNVIQGNDVGTIIGYGWGGGIHLVNPSSSAIIFSGNTVQDNHAVSSGGGVFVDDGASAVLSNNLITGNSVDEDGGAGIYVDVAGEGEAGDARSAATIINCTVAGNRGGSRGGNGVFIETSDVTVINSIFWDNGGDDFWTDAGGASLTVSFTLSEESIPGTGNVNQAPLFVDNGSDFHLQSQAGHWDSANKQWKTDTGTSPGIDSGDPGSAYSLEPADNGARINLGRYGNTAEASKSGAAASPKPSITSVFFLLLSQ